MKKYRIFFLIIIAALFFACNGNDHPSEKNNAISGEQLFKINCAQCHKPTGEFTGPALKNATLRWKNKLLLYEFIKNPQDIIAKDPYAKELFIKWKQAYMQPFPNLTNEEIDSILSYCDNAIE